MVRSDLGMSTGKIAAQYVDFSACRLRRQLLYDLLQMLSCNVSVLQGTVPFEPFCSLLVSVSSFPLAYFSLESFFHTG